MKISKVKREHVVMCVALTLCEQHENFIYIQQSFYALI